MNMMPRPLGAYRSSTRRCAPVEARSVVGDLEDHAVGVGDRRPRGPRPPSVRRAVAHGVRERLAERDLDVEERRLREAERRDEHADLRRGRPTSSLTSAGMHDLAAPQLVAEIAASIETLERRASRRRSRRSTLPTLDKPGELENARDVAVRAGENERPVAAAPSS